MTGRVVTLLSRLRLRASRTVELMLVAPEAPGRYALRVSHVQEFEALFATRP